MFFCLFLPSSGGVVLSSLLWVHFLPLVEQLGIEVAEQMEMTVLQVEDVRERHRNVSLVSGIPLQKNGKQQLER